MARYEIGEKVQVWWRGDYTWGRIISIEHSRCYKVRLTDGEICFRLESDLEKA